VGLGDLSRVTVEDLLGRQPIDVDEKGIGAFLQGKRILITGAGGSIGSELTRQVHRYGPALVGILDRDESAIQAVQLSIDGHGLLNSDGLILADIRDADRMTQVMRDFCPDIVFHAAALKHLPLLEMYPDEAFKTNVLGTVNVVSAALASGVSAFVNISTDKAADPTSVLGLSKLVTERVTAGAVDNGGHRYLSVRFGNVLGSRGSMLNTFRTQIDRGGPVTVTDPEVTRYFMTIPEAVHLVLQAASIGANSRTLILDMGQPVRIASVAEQLIEMSGRDIEITYVGLRPGETVHEILTALNESPEPTSHPLITQVGVSPVTPEDVINVDARDLVGLEKMRMLSVIDASEGETGQPVAS
jgi:dTDP-glucose 4,6-dehydratase